MSEENKIVVKEEKPIVVVKEEKPKVVVKEEKAMVKSKEHKSCFTRIQEARDRNKNDTYKCWSEVIQILLENCFTLVIFIFENLVGIVFLILSIVYLNDCPIRPSIPIGLLVFAIFTLIHGITLQIVRSKCFDIDDRNDGFATLAKVCLCIASFGTLMAFIVAVISIYDVFGSVKSDPTDRLTYCHRFFYWFSFYFVTFYLILMFVLLIFFCCILCVIVAQNDAVLVEEKPTVVVIHQMR